MFFKYFENSLGILPLWKVSSVHFFVLKDFHIRVPEITLSVATNLRKKQHQYC